MMSRTTRHTLEPCRARRLVLALATAIAVTAPGCRAETGKAATNSADVTEVQLTHPVVRKIVRAVGQPSFVESYERTSIFPKVTGFIEKWNVDIGDTVQKDQVLATLFVPELVEDYGTKKATVELDQARIEQALEVVEVAKADVEAAESRLEEAQSILAKFQAQVDRWKSEVERLEREVKKGVVDPQVLLESTNQSKASSAARDAAQAAIKTAQSELLSRKSTLAKSKVDVAVARADLSVAESEARRLKAWVGYLTLQAPFDGVVVARNANTGDFVMPVMGDPTAMQQAPFLAPNKAAPIYVVDRTDVVRIFVDIPEQDANYVHEGTKAAVLIRAFRDQLIHATVTRTSWALNVKSRTLRAEIDLHNSDAPEAYRDPGQHERSQSQSHGRIQMLPGMYAYGKVFIERPGVQALPVDVLVYNDRQTFVWMYADGKAKRTEIEVGVRDDHWVEVTNHRPAAREGQPNAAPWTPFDGSEQVISGDLSILSEGEAVKAADENSGADKEVAGPAKEK